MHGSLNINYVDVFSHLFQHYIMSDLRSFNYEVYLIHKRCTYMKSIVL